MFFFWLKDEIVKKKEKKIKNKGGDGKLKKQIN